MKRLIIALLAFSFLMLWPITASAIGTTTYQLDDVGISIDIPNDYMVFTRDTSQNDPNLSILGLTKAELTSLMEDTYSYLYAVDDKFQNEITVTMAKGSSIQVYSGISDSDLLEEAASLVDSFQEMGITVTKYDVYPSSQTKYLKIYSNRPSNLGTVYILQYSTSIGIEKINISLKSYFGSISTTKESILKGVVDSIVYKGVATPTASPSNTPAPSSSIYPQQSSNSEGFNLYWIPLVIVGVIVIAIIIGCIIKRKSQRSSGDDESALEMSSSEFGVPPYSEPKTGSAASAANNQVFSSSEVAASALPQSEIQSQNFEPSLPPIRFCRMCGEKVSSDSKFCPYCGANLVVNKL